MALVNGTARDTPVGPPWITTSSGYLRAGLKSTGLWRIPSIVATSWLFHDTTSSVLVAQFAACAFMSVIRLGLAMVTGATAISAIDLASEARNATRDPSRETLKLDPTDASAGARRVTGFAAGSRRNKCENVRCAAGRNSPLVFHATIDASSSNAVVRAAGAPPLAGTIAMTPFA